MGSEQLSRDVQEFWAWFQSAPATWPIGELADAKLDELFSGIERWFPDLTPTISDGPDAITIQFSAKLKPDQAAVIDALVRAAPTLAGWEFVAFQPPLGFHDIAVMWLDLPYDRMPTDWMRVHIVERSPVALRVFVPHYQPSQDRALDHAVRLHLEVGMGERWLLEQNPKLTFADVADAAHAPPFRQLRQLLG